MFLLSGVCYEITGSISDKTLFTYAGSAENGKPLQLLLFNGKRADRGYRVLERDDAFLKRYGYEDMDVLSAIRRLSARLQATGEFPHEIGVFLGYPLEDVTGFIDNRGKGFLRSGTWKVYSNIAEAEKTFYKYKKCTDIYTNLWEGGKSIWQLTVAA